MESNLHMVIWARDEEINNMPEYFYMNHLLDNMKMSSSADEIITKWLSKSFLTTTHVQGWTNNHDYAPTLLT